MDRLETVRPDTVQVKRKLMMRISRGRIHPLYQTLMHVHPSLVRVLA